jgi:hypothetical protein
MQKTETNYHKQTNQPESNKPKPTDSSKPKKLTRQTDQAKNKSQVKQTA